MLDLGVLLRVPYVETEMGFDISPDGRKAAFSWNPGGRWEVFEVPLEEGGVPRQVSSGEGGKFHPRYSPDGRSLAYTVDLDGAENYHVFLQELPDGHPVDLTPGIACSQQAFFTWSPDGKQIAYISDASGQFDVYLLPLEQPPGTADAPRPLLNLGYPAWKVRWSPDGRWLAVTVEASGADYGTFIASLKGQEVTRICDGNGPISAKDACWSPDSQKVAFCSDVHGNYDIGVYRLASRSLTWVTEGDGQKQYPSWSPDGSRLAYVFNRGAVSWLALQTPGQAPVLYQVEPGVHYLPRFLPNGERLIFGFDNPRHPTDLWSMTLDGVMSQRTQSLPASLPHSKFIMPEEVYYPGLDGTPVPALLFKTSRRKPGPGVLLIHGGPDWFFEMTWYPLMAHMASRGWTVLVTNYRGSTGYGKAWQAASRFDYGGVDRDDVAAGARYLIGEGLADPARIGITGRSHGGYLTACCMTAYPELWAVGSAVVPFLNWFTNHDEIRPDLQHWDLENFGDPQENHDLWYERSPGYFLDRIQAPLQLICGRQDARCPVSDSIQATEVLRQMGKEVDFILYEDEGHSFLKMENVLDSEQRRVAFLAKVLEQETASARGRGQG